MRHLISVVTVVALLAVIVSGCERDTGGLAPAPFSTDPNVFLDTFGDGVDYQAFLGSKLDAIAVDTSERYEGDASLRVTVPAPNDPSGAWAGGAFPTRIWRDLTSYNALTFYAKASIDATLDRVGLGNDNTGNSKYEAWWEGVLLTTSWKKYVVPIPLPARLAEEAGLFYFADNADLEGGESYTVWFDQIRFEKVGTISNPRPVINSAVLGTFVGAPVKPSTHTTFSVQREDGMFLDETIGHLPGYFTYTSSDESVVATANGDIRVVGPGTAVLTAKLGDVRAAGQITLNSVAPPTVAAPRPMHWPSDVISLFSNVYSNENVFAWYYFGTAVVTDLKVANDDIKAYTNLTFAGIQFKAPPPPPACGDVFPQIDATTMTHFHMDVWVPNATVFRVKLVDFGDDGRYGCAPDSEGEVPFNATTTPPLVNGEWVSLDIPLDNFGLVSRAHLAQLIISIVGVEKTVFIDNVYFHK